MKNCNFCGKTLNHVFIDLGLSPIANHYLTDLDQPETFYPLKVFRCGYCGLVQLPSVVPPQELFDSYDYFSSYSKMLVDQAKLYVDKVTKEFDIKSVIEIGSNDGYLLQFFKDIDVLGIEPAKNVAVESKVATFVGYFNSELVKQLHQVDLIIVNNVLAHIPDLNDFVLGLKLLLKPKGIITVEFPHLMQLIKNNAFDTIYHEHNFYFTLTVVEKIFAKYHLTIFDVDEIPNHGGSFRIYAKHMDNNDIRITNNAPKIKYKEYGLEHIPFAQRVYKLKRDLLKCLIDIKDDGKSIIGYGAPAKASTLLNYCGIRNDLLDYVVDDSPHKQNKFVPGVRLPIYPSDKIQETKPDFILLLAWNLKDEIMNKVDGKFIVPIPEVSYQ